MRVIVDTNVPVVANGQSIQASPGCVLACVRRLRGVQANDTLVLDDGWLILREYMANLRSSGQPGLGDAFLKWVLTNQANPRRCEQIHISPIGARPEDEVYAEFPDDARLSGFDPADRKFVAVASAHPTHPPILNAVDTGWRDYQHVLAVHDIQVQFLCLDAMV